MEHEVKWSRHGPQAAGPCRKEHIWGRCSCGTELRADCGDDIATEIKRHAPNTVWVAHELRLG